MTNGSGKLAEAAGLLEAACRTGDVANAALLVRQGKSTFKSLFGRFTKFPPVFLVASISKPMTAAGVMVLADRGLLSLSDPVCKFLLDFAGEGRELVTIRHLLTHTSGLPDMLPENVELRSRHATLDEFTAAICRTPLLFTPGAQLRYQSTGSLMAARIAEGITAMPFREFLRSEVFEPLGMRDTSLGLGGRQLADLVRCQVDTNEDWNWNSTYWRDLGAPWGGVHSTVDDIATFLDAFLHPQGLVLKPETAAGMIVNQAEGVPTPWGLGWMIKPGAFGQQCSPKTFGHFGTTGTLAWCDPAIELSFVLLTTKPVDNSRDGILGPVADLVSEWGCENRSGRLEG